MYATDVAIDKVRHAYNAPAWWYELRGIGLVFAAYRSTPWAQVGFFSRSIGDRHLEVPVGTGKVFALALRFRNRRQPPPAVLFGADVSDTMLAHARGRLRGIPNLSLLQADAARLPFADRFFESVTVGNGLHCFPDPGRALREIHRVLEQEGLLSINILLHPRGGRLARWISGTINRWAMKKGLLQSAFDLEGARRMIEEAGFAVTESRVTGNTWYVRARRG